MVNNSDNNNNWNRRTQIINHTEYFLIKYFFPGVKAKATCISGFCTSSHSKGNACQLICGQPNCDAAKDPGTCDLTKQLTSSFTGETNVMLNSKKFLLLFFTCLGIFKWVLLLTLSDSTKRSRRCGGHLWKWPLPPWFFRWLYRYMQSNLWRVQLQGCYSASELWPQETQEVLFKAFEWTFKNKWHWLKRIIIKPGPWRWFSS